MLGVPFGPGCQLTTSNKLNGGTGSCVLQGSDEETVTGIVQVCLSKGDGAGG